MKAIYSILILLFLAPVLINANTVVKNKSDVRNYKTELNLSQQQMNQLNTAYNNFQAQSKLEAPGNNGKERLKYRANRYKQMRQSVMQTLTPDQRRQYRAILGIKPVNKTK
jgi:uncharacterized protein YxeA